MPHKRQGCRSRASMPAAIRLMTRTLPMGVTELRGPRGPGGATSQAEGPGADLSPAPHSEGTGSPQRGFGSHHRRSLAWGQGSGLGAEAAESRAQIKHLLGWGGDQTGLLRGRAAPRGPPDPQLGWNCHFLRSGNEELPSTDGTWSSKLDIQEGAGLRLPQQNPGGQCSGRGQRWGLGSGTVGTGQPLSARDGGEEQG